MDEPIPQNPEQEGEKEEEVAAQPEAKPTGGGLNILLLDDDHFLLDMYSMKFTEEGNTVQACLATDEALDALRSGFKADAIVFDLTMPEKDGFEFLRILKEENLGAGAALIPLTNQMEDEERKKTEELGAHDYIVKASSVPSAVVKKVTEVARRHH